MANYFTSDHFKLLIKWKGTVYDKSNPEQQRIYEELGQAYDVTKQWAEALQHKLFKDGWNKTVRMPTDQWQKKFTHYNWGRIYPTQDAPNGLAYTVGINAEHGFIVKIDLVDNIVNDKGLRQKYEQIRGPITSSPIVAIKSAAEGLALDFTALIDWSVECIKNFKPAYDDIANQLGLSARQDQQTLLDHFQGHEDFAKYQPLWPSHMTELFVRLARAVNDIGLDWWFIKSGNDHLRFGRKEKAGANGKPVVWLSLQKTGIKISWYAFAGLNALNQTELTNEIVEIFESANKDEGSLLANPPPLQPRNGYWPDDYAIEDEPKGDQVIETALKSDKPPRNVIYYGPPGTGKTYKVSELLRRDYERTTTSVSAAEWRSQFIADRIAPLKWWEATVLALMDLDGKAKVKQLLEHPFIVALATAKGRKGNVGPTVWTTLQERTVVESTTVNEKRRVSPQVFDKSKESVWQLAGEWKDACVDLVALIEAYRAGAQASEIRRQYSFVTFHQSYGYEEFVEGLRPVLDGDTESGGIKYEIRPGAFKDLCRKARLAPDQHFAMVIDEINRGNISKIFGELITLIEPDKREGTENAISVTLPYSGEPFSVPPNVDIIGTMNTADRSLALLDTALRRRFDFEPVLPDVRDILGAPLFGLRVTLGEKVIDIRRMLSAINQRVEALYDRDHSIGHAYFTSLTKVPDGEARLVALSAIFRNRIVPLLEEYFFEDWQKIQLVLADNQKHKPKAARFVIESDGHGADLALLFGNDHGLETYATKPRYLVQEASFSNPDTYIGIYQTLPG